MIPQKRLKNFANRLRSRATDLELLLMDIIDAESLAENREPGEILREIRSLSFACRKLLLDQKALIERIERMKNQ